MNKVQNNFNRRIIVKKLNAIFLVVLFTLSLIVCSCSASGGISVGKEQNVKTVKLVK